MTPEEIPWDDIAFASTEFALRTYLADRAAGLEGYHQTVLDRRRPLKRRASGRVTGAFHQPAASWHNARARRIAGRLSP